MSVEEYFQTSKRFLSEKNGEGLANCFSLIDMSLPSFLKLQNTPLGRYRNPSFSSIIHAFQDEERSGRKNSLESQCSGYAKPYDEIVQCYLLVLKEHSRSQKLEFVYKAQANLVQAFLKSFASSDSNWELPVMKLLINNLRLLAKEADISNANSECCEDAARILPRFFSLSMTDRSPMPVSKKWGTLFIVNVLFKIYFRLNNLRLCNNVLRALENPQMEFPKIEEFMMSDQVTFKYLRGRIALNHNDFTMAGDLLSYAFAHCHRSSKTNKRLILAYLIVINAVNGKKPKKSLLVKYDFEKEFGLLIEAVFSGNIFDFRKAIRENQEFYIQRELYLIIQLKLKNLLYRNLFKKVYLVCSNHMEQDSRLPLPTLERIMKYLKVDTDLDELECIMINMINDASYNTSILSFKSHYLYRSTFVDMSLISIKWLC